MKVSKTSRRANAASQASDIDPAAFKDDGTRWIVVSERTGHSVYGQTGTIKGEALRLANGLLDPARIEQIEV